MGLIFSNIFKSNFEKRILLLGLDNSGKTTILYKLNKGEFLLTTPTIGFNVESFKYKKTTFIAWDVGGQDRLRKLWNHYFEKTHGIIFVIDINDSDRISSFLDEIKKLLSDDKLVNVPFLIFGNKNDLGIKINTMHIYQEIDSYIQTNKLHNKFYINLCSAKTGNGLYEGLDWLDKEIELYFKNIKSNKI